VVAIDLNIVLKHGLMILAICLEQQQSRPTAMSNTDPTRPVTIADLKNHAEMNAAVIELQIKISNQQNRILEKFEDNDDAHKDLIRSVSGLAKDVLDMRSKLLYFIMPLVAIIPTAISAYVSFNK
jgi:hypothetical protein